MTRRSFATPDGILASASECGLDKSAFRQVPGPRALQLLDQIFQAFTRKGIAHRRSNWFWDDLRPPTYSFHRPADTRRLPAVAPDGTLVYLVVEDFSRRKKESPFWLFEGTLEATLGVLDNHHLLEFYVVDRKFQWLLAENHHDVLIAVGEPATSALRQFEESTRP